MGFQIQGGREGKGLSLNKGRDVTFQTYINISFCHTLGSGPQVWGMS